MSEESWLIEGAEVYWCGRSPDNFLKDVNEAVRFAREQDAWRVLAWIVPEQIRNLCRVTSHIWVPPAEFPAPREKL